MDASGNLVTIDPLTAAETFVGNTGLGADTNTFAGLTDGALYALDASAIASKVAAGFRVLPVERP